MDKHELRRLLAQEFEEFGRALATEEGEWIVKGFIDVYRNIYTISVDTKVVSKIIELMLLPVLSRFAREHRFRMLLSQYQNHYPDITLITADDVKFAIDLKSTYRTSSRRVNGFTLGAFTGYFRDRLVSLNS